MATLMTGSNFRQIQDFQAKIARPLRKIDIFKPDWMEACVKSPQ